MYSFNRFFTFIFLGLIMLSFSACKKDNASGNLTIHMKAKYGSQSFSLGSVNTDPAGRRVEIDDLKFYLSNITLVKTDNSEVQIKDVALFDFSNNGSLTLNVNSTEGDFKAIKFGCGLDSIENNTDPLSVPSDNPLSNDNGMAWPMLQKYQFVFMDGKSDTVAGERGLLRNPLIYHIGTNSFYRHATLTQNFSICCNKPTTLTITLDIEKVFYGSSETLDILTEGVSQATAGNSSELAIAAKFADNFSQAFTF